MPVWHASLAVLNFSGVVQLRNVWNKDRLRKIAKDLIADVGTGELFQKETETTIHMRRALSIEEVAGLDPAWLAIPAVDIAG